MRIVLMLLYGAFGLLLAACSEGTSSDGSGPSNVKIIKDFWNRPAQSYTWDRIGDPTGTAPTSRVERFALRDGHCRGRDCQASRARVERHFLTDLQDGDRLRYSYSIYIPSSEFNVVRGVSTTMGQVYLSGNKGNDNGGNPIWDLNTTERGSSWYMRMLAPIPGTSPIETRVLRRFDVGPIPFDRWVRVTVEAKLSTGPDGFIQAFVDGRSIGRVTGPNTLQNAYVEYDYGLYQKLFGLLEAGGTREGISEQVLLYSDVEISRLP